MSKLTCYIDGSQIKEKGEIRQGWAFLAFHTHGETVEMNGSYHGPAADKMRSNWYEILAFYNAVKYAISHGYKPEEVSFYTDCDWVAYGGFHLVPENYSGRRDGVMERIKLLKALFYKHDETLVETMAEWLVKARHHWVKGHRIDVNNNRVDYLARSAIYSKPVADVMEFNEWLRNGFTQWDHNLQQNTQYIPPFTESVQ
ncbi:MAG TPA: RNase H family protein [Methanosarcina sp.]|nr:RNase H family protein [Methanosarcina sp.]